MLMWALGCVWASYRDRYFSQWRPEWKAAGIGVGFTLTNALVTTILMILAWSPVFGSGVHPHLRLELWLIGVFTLPSALLAAGFGVWLARATRASSMSLPYVSLNVWVSGQLGHVVLLSRQRHIPLRVLWDTLWENFVSWPLYCLASVVLPAVMLVLGFRLMARTESRPRPDCAA
jgi:hypothetical protein